MLKDVIIDKLMTVSGTTYSYDSTRSKWLSIGKSHILYGIDHKHINTSRWLAVANGIYSNNIGFKMLDNGTITKAALQSKNSTTCEFIIIKGLVDVILTLELNSEPCKLFSFLSVDFDQGDALKCYVKINGNTIDYPFIVLEYAARID